MRRSHCLSRASVALQWTAASAVFFATPAYAADRVADGQSPMMAAIVLNFARFTDWEPARFGSPGAPVVLCADPSDAFTAALSRLDGQAVGTRHLTVKRTPVDQFDAGCHMAFIPPGAASAAHMQSLEKQGVLVVGEGDEFTRKGDIALVRVGREIRFEVNDSAARRSGVKLSSKLLRLALAVR